MDYEDERTRVDRYGSVSFRLFVVMKLHVADLIELACVGSMATGLGATPEEWEELKGNVDDSFWVMRAIGSLVYSFFVFAVKR